MTALLALTTVLAFGSWIPVAQALPGVPQRSRVFYVAVGNAVFALGALAIGGGHLSFGWRAFWLPFVGGLVWIGGNYCAFRATETVGLARASGSWSSLNIVVAFVWGALLFDELADFTAVDFVLLGIGLLLIVGGILFILGSQRAQGADALSVEMLGEGLGSPLGSSPPEPGPTPALTPARKPATAPARTPATAAPRTPAGARDQRIGYLYAGAAGLLWGSYFVPAQWAKIPAQVSNVPLALGILVGGVVLVASSRDPVVLRPRVAATQLSAGVLFGIGDLALLGLVARVGTGVGFTIAQLSLLVNATVGIFIFKVPEPRSRAARIVIIGILLAATGGVLIGKLG